MASEEMMLSELRKFPNMEKFTLSQLKPLELDESLNPNLFVTPRYGDGNIESDQIERDLIHKSQDKLTSSQIKSFIRGGDESSSPENQPYPLCRLKFLGRGQSSSVYKSVLVNRMIVCAEKVVVVGNASKRVQLVRELESLKFSLQYKQDSSDETSSSSASSMYCPYIVNLIDVLPNPRDGTLSVCLEYMDGGSLQDIVSMGGCSQERVLVGIASQMLTGLAFLHSKRIVHRDIKPSNVLFSSNGVVKLADFGLARALDEGNSMADSFIGTFDYMSPERLKGGNYTFVSDIWSFGLTIHAVAVGKYPYHVVRGYWSIMNAIQEQEPPLPSAEIFTAAFIEFIALTCTKDPELRPTAASLLQHPFMTSQDLLAPVTSTTSATSNSLPPISPTRFKPPVLGVISNVDSSYTSVYSSSRDESCGSSSGIPSPSAGANIKTSPEKSRQQTTNHSTANSTSNANSLMSSPLHSAASSRAGSRRSSQVNDNGINKFRSPKSRQPSRSRAPSVTSEDASANVAHSYGVASHIGNNVRLVKALSGSTSTRRPNDPQKLSSHGSGSNMDPNSKTRWSPALFRRGKSKEAVINPRKELLEESTSFLKHSLTQKDFHRLKAINIAAAVIPNTSSSSKHDSNIGSGANTPTRSRTNTRSGKYREKSPGQIITSQSISTSTNKTPVSTTRGKSRLSSRSATRLPASMSSPSMSICGLSSPVTLAPLDHVPSFDQDMTIVPVQGINSPVIGPSSGIKLPTLLTTASPKQLQVAHDPNLSGYNTPRNPVPNYHNHVGEFSTSRRQSLSMNLSPSAMDAYGISPAFDGRIGSPSNHQSSEILKIVDAWKLYVTRKLANPNRQSRGLADILRGQSSGHQHYQAAAGEPLALSEQTIPGVWNISMIDALGMEKMTNQRVKELSDILGFSSASDLQVAFDEAGREIEELVAQGKILRYTGTAASNSNAKADMRKLTRRSMSSNDSLDFDRLSLDSSLVPTAIPSPLRASNTSPFTGTSRRQSQSAGAALQTSSIDSGIDYDKNFLPTGLFIETDENMMIDYSADEYEDDVFETVYQTNGVSSISSSDSKATTIEDPETGDKTQPSLQTKFSAASNEIGTDLSSYDDYAGSQRILMSPDREEHHPVENQVHVKFDLPTDRAHSDSKRLGS
jgi:serine/threonine protein kinase